MSKIDTIQNIIYKKRERAYLNLAVGQVIDVNDPQEMGRVRVIVPYYGDTEDMLVEDIPWASPISPLSGTMGDVPRGRDETFSKGPVGYGMFNVPQVGAFVLVGCFEGDPRYRFYLGCLHDQFLIHTMPHGRYFYKSVEGFDGKPEGPLTSTETELEPLYSSFTQCFTKTSSQQITSTSEPPKPRDNYEFRTRVADNGVGGINSRYINSEDVLISSLEDDKEEVFTENDGNVISHTHGYSVSLTVKDITNETTGKVYNPSIYSWTTPGFHSISMDDNPNSCKIKIRTTAGHQILMDDTNERIYINTAQGKTWIEIDEKGNIDIYGERHISVHAEKDINFTAGDTFRVKAKNGIHMISEDEIRLHSKGVNGGDLHIKSDTNLRINSLSETRLEAVGDVHFKLKANALFDVGSGLDFKSGSDAKFDSSGSLHLKAGSSVNIGAGSNLNLKAGGDILNTASSIHLNGPSAADPASANSASLSEIKESWWTNRIPEHEPWARVMTTPDKTDQDKNNTHEDAAEFSYDDPNVGKIERGENLNRNKKWHR